MEQDEKPKRGLPIVLPDYEVTDPKEREALLAFEAQLPRVKAALRSLEGQGVIILHELSHLTGAGRLYRADTQSRMSEKIANDIVRSVTTTTGLPVLEGNLEALTTRPPRPLRSSLSGYNLGLDCEGDAFHVPLAFWFKAGWTL